MGVPFSLLQSDHTGITVRDMEAALTFWQGAMGFELLYRERFAGELPSNITGVPGADLEIAMLSGAGHKIELLHYFAPEGRDHVRPRACDTGSVHLAFAVDDLDAAIAHVAASGFKAAGIPQTIPGGPRLVYLQDPDGTTIEFIQPPAG